MNSKMQFHQPAIMRVTATLGNTNEKQSAFNNQPGGKSGDRGTPPGGAFEEEVDLQEAGA